MDKVTVVSVLWRCWLGSRKGVWPVKNCVVRCWRGCLEQGADLHMAQSMPLPLTVSCFSKIQIGFTLLITAYPSRPGRRAIKRVCVCVCKLRCWWSSQLTARSTKWSLPARTLCLPSGPLSLHSTVTVKIAWDRELCAFMLVAPTTPTHVYKQQTAANQWRPLGYIFYARVSFKRVKVAHTRLPSAEFRSWSRFLAVSLQVTWIIKLAVGCHYFLPGLQLPPQPLRWLLPILLLGEQRHNGCEQFASRLLLDSVATVMGTGWGHQWWWWVGKWRLGKHSYNRVETTLWG